MTGKPVFGTKAPSLFPFLHPVFFLSSLIKICPQGKIRDWLLPWEPKSGSIYVVSLPCKGLCRIGEQKREVGFVIVRFLFPVPRSVPGSLVVDWMNFGGQGVLFTTLKLNTYWHWAVDPWATEVRASEQRNFGWMLRDPGLCGCWAARLVSQH